MVAGSWLLVAGAPCGRGRDRDRGRLTAQQLVAGG